MISKDESGRAQLLAGGIKAYSCGIEPRTMTNEERQAKLESSRTERANNKVQILVEPVGISNNTGIGSSYTTAALVRLGSSAHVTRCS